MIEPWINSVWLDYKIRSSVSAMDTGTGLREE